VTLRIYLLVYPILSCMIHSSCPHHITNRMSHLTANNLGPETIFTPHLSDHSDESTKGVHSYVLTCHDMPKGLLNGSNQLKRTPLYSRILSLNGRKQKHLKGASRSLETTRTAESPQCIPPGCLCLLLPLQHGELQPGWKRHLPLYTQ